MNNQYSALHCTAGAQWIRFYGLNGNIRIDSKSITTINRSKTVIYQFINSSKTTIDSKEYDQNEFQNTLIILKSS